MMSNIITFLVISIALFFALRWDYRQIPRRERQIHQRIWRLRMNSFSKAMMRAAVTLKEFGESMGHVKDSILKVANAIGGRMDEETKAAYERWTL